MQELEIEKRFLVPEEKLEELMGVVIADSRKMMNDVYIQRFLYQSMSLRYYQMESSPMLKKNVIL